MFSSSFDFKDSLFNNNTLPLFTSNTDYNMRTYLQNIKYDFPLNDAILKDSDLGEDYFIKNSLFSDDYSCTFMPSFFDCGSYSIPLDEDKQQKNEIKAENKIVKNKKNSNSDKTDEFNLSNENGDTSVSFSNDMLKKMDKLSDEESKEKKEQVFNVVYPRCISLFNENKAKNNNLYPNINKKEKINIFKSSNKEMLSMKRSNTRKPRRENRDNIRKKIKRGFLNSSLIKNLNDILKSIGNPLFFEKFPQNFVSDVVKQSNKEILNLSLNEIFEKKELYKKEDYPHYYHNLKVVKNEEVKKNIVMRKILDKKYYELFDEYINSNEFKIDEINRLKNNGMNDEYIDKYLCLSKHFIEFFMN